jgi:hypothetical protein
LVTLAGVVAAQSERGRAGAEWLYDAVSRRWCSQGECRGFGILEPGSAAARPGEQVREQARVAFGDLDDLYAA